MTQQSYADYINNTNYVPSSVKCYVTRDLATDNQDLNEAVTMLFQQHLKGIVGLSSSAILIEDGDTGEISYTKGRLEVTVREKPGKIIQKIIQTWMKTYLTALMQPSATVDLLFVEYDEDVHVIDAWIVKNVRPEVFEGAGGVLDADPANFPTSVDVSIGLTGTRRTGVEIEDGEVEALLAAWNENNANTPMPAPEPEPEQPSTQL